MAARDTAFFGNLANSYTVTVSTTVGNSLLGSPLIEIDTTALIGSRHFPSVARRRQISSTSPLRAILLPV